jgi:Secretion system C-terminal sorting domain
MRIVILFLVIFCIGASAYSQRKVIVPEGFGTLNEILRKDTLAGGQRKDPNTIYVLRRGGVYLLSGTILSTGFHLRLEAEQGSGPRPFVQMGFLEGGTQVEELFEVRGDLTFRGIHVSAINEFNTYIARVITASSPDARLRFYDCIVDGSGQTFIRINSSGNSVYMLNTTVSRMGRPSNPDNGRVIDDRGNQMDSIVVENNTWYNITSRIIRDGGAEINYVKLNQNTFINVGQRLAAIGAVKHLIFTNNIAVNSRFLGNSLTSDIVSLEFTPFGDTPAIILDYNNIYYEQEVLDAYVTLNNAGVQRLLPPFVAPQNQIYIDNATGLLNEPLSFQNKPVSPVEFILQSELGNGSSVPDWDWTGATSGNAWEITGNAYHNFSYPMGAISFTASSKGEPLGDLRWFPDYDVAAHVVDVIQQAQQLILRQADNPVLEGSSIALATLEAEINQAITIAANINSTGAELAEVRNTLRIAMEDFQASLIITAVEDLNGGIDVYPNPTFDFIKINSVRDAEIRLLAVDGRLLISETITLDLRTLPSGFYFIQLNHSGGQFIKKIIKQ